MADRLALVIAVETYQDAAVPPAALAEADGAAFAQLLEPLGFAREHQVVLLGSQATRTAVASRLRKLLKGTGECEALFVFYAGHGFTADGEGYLTGYDSQLDDLPDTSIALADLIDVLSASRCGRVALFLDARAGLPADALPPDGDPHLPAEPLAGSFGSGAGRACFTSCRPGEESQAAPALKGGVWAHHLREALAGLAPRALEDCRLLTADSLQGYLEQEVPRTLRSQFKDLRRQTPCLYAPAGQRFVVADLSPVLARGVQPTADPRLQPLKRGSLRAESTARVKALSGYRKFHRLPDRVNASSQKFVAELAAEDVRADVDAYYAAVREHLGYKRRDVESSSDRGSGFVRTPDFEYSVSVEMAADDPQVVVWRREVTNIRTPEVVLSPEFGRVFGGLFDTLVFEFVRPFDLEAWVDRVEDEMPAGVKVRCASDCSSCDVSVAGNASVIRLRGDRVEIQGGKTPTSKGLVEAFLRFQDLFAGQRDLQALPLAKAGE
jgi:hypothetical protein